MTPKMISIIAWVLRIVAALIMLQTLYFKFSGSEESIYIFSRIGMEPWGRYLTGAMELAAAFLILFPATTVIGALLAIGLMAGAIWFHSTTLGIAVMNDGGLLFFYAVLVFISSFTLVMLFRQDLVKMLRYIFQKETQ